MAHLVKCLSRKYMDLNLISGAKVKEPHVMIHTCNTKVTQVETREIPKALWPANLASCDFKANVGGDLFSKTKVSGTWGATSARVPVNMHTHTRKFRER